MFLPKNFWKAVERMTNVAIILAVCLMAFFVYRNNEINRPETPKIGSVLSPPPGYKWNSNSRTLLLVLRKGCHFCEASMPFYRKLYSLEKRNDLRATIIAAFPDAAQDASGELETYDLPIPSVSQVSLSSLHVSGTPTLILVNGVGKVEKTWVGQLDAEGEQSVLAAVKRATP